MIEDYKSPQNVWIINHDYRSMYVFLYGKSSWLHKWSAKVKNVIVEKNIWIS